jgi:hypothetical protein
MAEAVAELATTRTMALPEQRFLAKEIVAA